MGACCFCLTDDSGMKIADWIALAGIFINAGIGIWIVLILQNKLANKRVLKDHLISEVKIINLQFQTYFESLINNQVKPKDVIPWFKLMNIKIDDVMNIIATRFKINKKLLNPFQNDLRELITNHQDYINLYQSNNPIILSQNLYSMLMKFQQDNNSLFNSLIIEINDSK
jgi:hypothetical protein